MLDTVIEGKTGLFHQDQTAESLADAIKAFETQEGAYDVPAMREHAASFAKERFKARMGEAIQELYQANRARQGHK